jgi:hypothetical protein
MFPDLNGRHTVGKNVPNKAVNPNQWSHFIILIDITELIQHSGYRKIHIGARVAARHVPVLDMVWLYRSPIT